MKKQILTFVIGILVGAILTVGIFMLRKPSGMSNDFKKGNFEKNGQMTSMDENGRPERPGENGNIENVIDTNDNIDVSNTVTE